MFLYYNISSKKPNRTHKRTQEEEGSMSQVDIYRRIMAAMPEDEEVITLCRKYIERSENSSNHTAANLDMVAKHMATKFYDEEHAVTAKDLADSINSLGEATDDWNTRKASYYLTRLAKENKVEKVVAKGSPNKYYFL